jgi:hypothetical protein
LAINRPHATPLDPLFGGGGWHLREHAAAAARLPGCCIPRQKIEKYANAVVGVDVFTAGAASTVHNRRVSAHGRKFQLARQNVSQLLTLAHIPGA